MSRRVLILGAGLAGLATAQALAGRGLSITLLESRNRTGGRASSFMDVQSGQMIDACQHVSMGCCTNLAHFCRSTGIAHRLAPQPQLYFMTPDRRVSVFQSDPLPAPFHLTRSFFAAHYLSAAEKGRVAWGLAQLKLTSRDDDPPFGEWLRRHGQTKRTIDRFWTVVLTSALNEETDLIGLKYARKVFVDGFLTHRRGFEVEVPTVPLGQLYGSDLLAWYEQHQIPILLDHSVRKLVLEQNRIAGVELRSGEQIPADVVISTLPFDRLLDILPGALAELPYFSRIRNLQTSPITSVHLWYDRPVMKLPHVVLVGCVGQWVFSRGEVTPGEHYLQIVVSASRALRSLGHEEVRRRIVEEFTRLFPAAASANLLRSRVVTEVAATFSVVPGVDQYRPMQQSPVENFFVAGDWTATGWPATMEGAVRSGYLAAEAYLSSVGQKTHLVQPDLR